MKKRKKFLKNLPLSSVLLPSAALFLASTSTAFPTTKTHTPIHIATAEHRHATTHTTLASFNAKVYLLAYNTFLANRNLKDAYRLAYAAVEQNPRSLSWRRRLMQVALWLNHTNVALAQQEYIAFKTKNPKDVDKAIALAKTTHNHDVLEKLMRFKLKHNKSKKTWTDFISALEQGGKAPEAIKHLLHAVETKTTAFYLKELARLHHLTGNTHAERKTLESLTDKFGSNPQVALRIAEIFYSKNEIEKAHDVLVEVEPYAKKTDAAYWKTFGSIAWIMQDNKNAYIAYTTLEKTGQIGPDELQNLVTLTSDTHPKQAFRYAEQGWAKYHTIFFMTSLLNLGAQENQWQDLQGILSNMTHKQRAQFKHNEYFWSVYGNASEKLGKHHQALTTYLLGIKYNPASDDLKVDYLWLLINNHDSKHLQITLANWEHYLKPSSPLWRPMAAGYLMIGQPNRAIHLYAAYTPTHEQNYRWLTDFAEIVDQAGRHEQAKKIRELAWHQLLNAMENHPKTLNAEQITHYAKLAPHFGSTDDTAAAMKLLQTHHPRDTDNELLLAWAIEQTNDELVSKIRERFTKTHTDLPSWAELSIALRQNDGVEMKRLLDANPGLLPRRDRVNAATRIEEIPLAQDFAYHSLETYDDDPELYQLFSDVMLRTSDYVATRFTYRTVSTVEGPQFWVQGRTFVSPSTSLLPYVEHWTVHSNDKSLFIVPIPFDREEGVVLNIEQPHGLLQVGVGYRQALEKFANAFLEKAYRLTSKLFSRLRLDYHKRTDDTAALAIGAMQNAIQLNFDYRLNAREALSSEFSYKNYYAQSNVRLGNSQNLSVLYNYHYQFAYPDFNLSLFASAHNYNRSGSARGSILKLVPAAQTPSLAFFIPQGYAEWGASFQFGEAYLTSYTHAWRPFGRISVYQNSNTGIGKSFDVGIAGSVLGRDHLALYFRQSTSQTTQDQINRDIELRYQYFF